MRIGWVGFHVEGIPALRGLLERGVAIEAVLTLQPEQAAKRSGVADYASLCAEFAVPRHEIKNINDDEAIRILRHYTLDVVFVIGWSQIVRSEALGTARAGMIGAHASLLPLNRGRAPINWALIKGATETGNSLIWLAENVDEGDIIAQTKFPITLYDTCATLYEKVAASNREMILDVLPQLIAGKRPGRPQALSDEPLLPGRKPEDGRIDWAASGLEVYNFVRALARPYPGAFGSLDGKRWIVRECALLPTSAFFYAACHGQIVGAIRSPIERACGQIVTCGTSAGSSEKPGSSWNEARDEKTRGRTVKSTAASSGGNFHNAIVLLELESEDGEVLKGSELSEQGWEGKIWSNDEEESVNRRRAS